MDYPSAGAVAGVLFGRDARLVDGLVCRCGDRVAETPRRAEPAGARNHGQVDMKLSVSLTNFSRPAAWRTTSPLLASAWR